VRIFSQPVKNLKIALKPRKMWIFFFVIPVCGKNVGGVAGARQKLTGYATQD
jgi:hypothetical protein